MIKPIYPWINWLCKTSNGHKYKTRLHTQNRPVNTTDPLLSHSLIPPPISLPLPHFSSSKCVCIKYLDTQIMNLLCPCQSTSWYKINSQLDCIRRAQCNIWTTIRMSDNHARIIFRIHVITMLLLCSTNWRKRLISGLHLFAMSFSFHIAESRQVPVQHNLQHWWEWIKEGATVGGFSFCWSLGEGHSIYSIFTVDSFISYKSYCTIVTQSYWRYCVSLKLLLNYIFCKVYVSA